MPPQLGKSVAGEALAPGMDLRADDRAQHGSAAADTGRFLSGLAPAAYGTLRGAFGLYGRLAPTRRPRVWDLPETFARRVGGLRPPAYGRGILRGRLGLY